MQSKISQDHPTPARAGMSFSQDDMGNGPGYFFEGMEMAFENGFIKIYRKLMEWEWYQKSEMVHLFIHLLLKANWKDSRFQGHEVKRGQVVTGRETLSIETGISEQTIRTCLNRLKETKEITIKSTNKFSIVTINNYELYQSTENGINHQTNQQLTSNQPTTNQQLTTSEELKEVQEGKKELIDAFEKCWLIYPIRNGKRVGKKAALEIYLKVIKTIEDARYLYIAIINYSKADTIPKDMERFLKKDYWRDWIAPPISQEVTPE